MMAKLGGTLFDTAFMAGQLQNGRGMRAWRDLLT